LNEKRKTFLVRLVGKENAGAASVPWAAWAADDALNVRVEADYCDVNASGTLLFRSASNWDNDTLLRAYAAGTWHSVIRHDEDVNRAGERP
jgi:hypothetical protein